MLRHIWESSQRLSSRVWHWYSPSAHAIWGTVIRGRQRFDRSGIRCRAEKNSLLIQHGISDRPGIRGSAEHSWSALNNDSSVTGTLEVKLFDVCSSPVFFSCLSPIISPIRPLCYPVTFPLPFFYLLSFFQQFSPAPPVLSYSLLTSSFSASLSLQAISFCPCAHKSWYLTPLHRWPLPICLLCSFPFL